MAKSSVIKVLQSPADSIELAIQSFKNHNKARGLSTNTIYQYNYLLTSFIKHTGNIPPCSVKPDDIRMFLSNQLETHSSTTAQHCYITLNVFFGYLFKEGLIDTSPMINIEKPKRRKQVINTFSVSDIENLLKGCSTRTFLGARDKALIMLMIDCGFRATEVCNIKGTDINWTDSTILVLGKGDKERVVPFGQSTRQCLNSYIAKRGELDTDNLFVNQYGQPFDRCRLLQIIKSRCIKAGIEGVRCSPHTFRHTFAVSFLRNGADVFSLQKILGHSDLSMTRHYAELSNTDIMDKHRLYSPGDSLMPKQTTGRKRLR